MAELVSKANESPSVNDNPTCLIVSDVLLYREGLARGLRILGKVNIAEPVSSKDAAASITKCLPDIVVLDISRHEALETIRPLVQQRPSLPVVGFGIGGHSDALRCGEIGISCFVGRDEGIEDLDIAIQKALRGEAVCNPRLMARLVRHLAALIDNAQVQTNNCLTSREREVAALVKRGMSNKEIAMALGISPATVKNHVHMILEKLNMPRRTSIALAV